MISKKITMYSKKGCPNCIRSVTLMESNKWPYEVVKIDENEDARAWLMSQGHKQLPQFYVGDKLLQGSYLGLCKMSKEEIEALLYGSIDK